MMRTRSLGLLAAAVLAPWLSGCNPFAMGFLTPVPVMPWVTERMEEKYCHKNDYRTPILPPIPEGAPPPMCEDPPSDSEVLRTMPRVFRGMPYVYEEFRDEIQIVYERLVDRIDPPRFFPLIGPAQLHHCHWKATIYYNETIESAYPIDDTQLPKVVAVLEKRFGRKLNANVVVNSELIGGIRVAVGDEVLDTSVRARLERMRLALVA